MSTQQPSTTPGASHDGIVDEGVLYEEQVEPEYGILGFTLRELLIVAAWLVAFVVSFFPVIPGSSSVWTQGIAWVLPIGVPTAATFLIVLRRLSPDGIRRVGSLGIDQFASVAFSVATVAWAQLLWSAVVSSLAFGQYLAGWMLYIEVLAMIALVALTVAAPLIPRIRDDFHGRLETLAHRSANPVRPVIPHPRAPRPAAGAPDDGSPVLAAEPSAHVPPAPESGAAASPYAVGSEPPPAPGPAVPPPPADPAAPPAPDAAARRSDAPAPEGHDEDLDRTRPRAVVSSAPGDGERGVDGERDADVERSEDRAHDEAPERRAPMSWPLHEARVTGPAEEPPADADADADADAVDELHELFGQDPPPPAGGASLEASATAEPFWILASTDRDVLDEHGQPLFRIGPRAWALVIEDRGGAYVVRDDDGRIGYLHDISDITKG